MTISRRPNRRASIENAPGPRRTRAIAIEIARKQAILDEKRLRRSPWREEKWTAITAAAPAMAARPTEWPSWRATPAAIDISAIRISGLVVPCHSARSAAASTRSGTPSAIRKTSRPIPGHPGAKVEKDRCSQSPSRAPRPKARLYLRLNAIVQMRIALMGYF